MTTTIYRTADGWFVQTPAGAARVETAATTTAELLADRAALTALSKGVVPLGDLDLVSPVTTPCRVVAQMTNYRSHVIDTGMDPKTIPLTFFRKASGSVCGPTDEIVRPAHVGLLDYEVEVGLVIGKSMPVGSEITEANVFEYVAGLVVTNDISARDVQLPKTQFYEAKSYPTFTPVGPALVLLDEAEWRRFGELNLHLEVNGEERQHANVGEDMIFGPAAALAGLSAFQRLEPGDVVLTGTPVGTALSAPGGVVGVIANLLPPAVKWRMFFAGQARNPKYLHDGDVITAHVSTPDGQIDLGTQRNVVRYQR